MHIKCRNVNNAFRRLVRVIEHSYRKAGSGFESVATYRTASRNGPVIQVAEPVTVTYSHPRERVLFNKARDANPFFHVFESLWMLAGRNDIEPLWRYVKTYAQFSDDGKTANGAYGYRWRHGLDTSNDYREEWDYSVDQLKIIVDHLKRKPESRRAVLQMWDVESDLLKIDTSKDVCCLSGETTFRSPEGDTSIEDLAKRFQTRKSYRFPVYSIDAFTGNQQLAWMTSAWKTGKKPVLKIGLDDGSFIRLTTDHVVFKKRYIYEGKGRGRKGRVIEECRAGDLLVGDSLLAEMPEAASCRVRGGGYRVFRRNIFKGTEHSNLTYEHREYLRLSGDLLDFKIGYLIHHKNSDKLDNRLDNLEQILIKDHGSKHMQGLDNPWFKRSQASKTKHSEAMKNRSEGVKQKFRKAGVDARKKMEKELPPDLRRALFTKKSCLTQDQQRLIDAWNESKSNHKIVSIERDGVETVYDFTVPGRHNAVLSNGVLVHNCNLNAMFSLRKQSNNDSIKKADGDVARDVSYLDMTVTNRSNDLILGMLGANVVHFSFLQEYMAACLGVEVGVYNHFSNNVHCYTESFSGWKPDEWLAEYNGNGGPVTYGFDSYPHQPFPLVRDVETFDREVCKFIDNTDPTRRWEEPFLDRVASPMVWAYELHKRRDYVSALNACALIEASDWREACVNWVTKRKDNHERKQATGTDTAKTSG